MRFAEAIICEGTIVPSVADGLAVILYCNDSTAFTSKSVTTATESINFVIAREPFIYFEKGLPSKFDTIKSATQLL